MGDQIPERKEYYFISDLHIGGDGELGQVHFKEEMITFLKSLESHDKDTELIIAGDAFGLWEFTSCEGVDQLRCIAAENPELFEQLKKTGEKIVITVIPGNHDHDLAAFDGFKELMMEFNMSLETTLSVERKIGNSLIWIEHGHQYDNMNRIEQFGDPASRPFGYFITRYVLSMAGQRSRLGRRSWLSDIECVQPNEELPKWALSNYFYKEMNPFLRFIIVPIVLFITFAAVFLVFSVLGLLGIGNLDARILETLQNWGIIGRIIEVWLIIDVLLLQILILISIPLLFFYKDVNAALKRYGFKFDRKDLMKKREIYLNHARQVLSTHPHRKIFVFGHTHNPLLINEGGKVILNTGTWLERHSYVRATFPLMPPVYYHSFQLNYFRVYKPDSKIRIEYCVIPKEVNNKLTLLERFATALSKKPGPISIPPVTEIEDLDQKNTST